MEQRSGARLPPPERGHRAPALGPPGTARRHHRHRLGQDRVLPAARDPERDRGLGALPRAGLTALLVYPMNALANDQEERIRQYLEASGHTHVRVARYDRTTREEERASLRETPPHILLTNYMMLEYLLVRPRIGTRSSRTTAAASWCSTRSTPTAATSAPTSRCCSAASGRTSATPGRTGTPTTRGMRALPDAPGGGDVGDDQERRRDGHDPGGGGELRDEAVREFLAKLTGSRRAVRVLGEDLRARDAGGGMLARGSAAAGARIRRSGGRAPRAFAGRCAARRRRRGGAAGAAILWKLDDLLARRPMSVSQIVERIRERGARSARRAIRRPCAGRWRPRWSSAPPSRTAARVRCACARTASSGAAGASTAASTPTAGGSTRWARSGARAATSQRRSTSAAPAAPTRCASAGRRGGPEALRPNASGTTRDEWVLYDRAR